MDDRWTFLESLSASAWLRRYAAVFTLTRKTREAVERRISFGLFKRHIRYISLLHSRVLQPSSKCKIPVPTCNRIAEGGDLPWQKQWVMSSSSSFGSSGSDNEAHDNGARMEIRELLGQLRTECCLADTESEIVTERSYAFTPTEVRQMVESACGTQEQLILMLLLTTGMRIGGVARVQLPDPSKMIRSIDDVPDELVTTEKHNRCRRIRATRCVRILIARWYNHGRRQAPDDRAPSPYLFPSPSTQRSAGHVTPRHVWQVCRGMFDRVGLRGPSVHPHTFRHTVVQMLFMTGSSFEAIAKWIGHASPAVTSSVYGRLSLRDVESSLGTVPFLSDHLASNTENDNNEWHSLSRFLRSPYQFFEDRSVMMDDQDEPSQRPTKQMRRELLQRAKISSKDTETTVQNHLRQQLERIRELQSSIGVS